MSATIHAYYVKRTAKFECEIRDDYDDRYVGGFETFNPNYITTTAKNGGYNLIMHNYKFDRNLGLIAS